MVGQVREMYVLRRAGEFDELGEQLQVGALVALWRWGTGGGVFKCGLVDGCEYACTPTRMCFPAPAPFPSPTSPPSTRRQQRRCRRCRANWRRRKQRQTRYVMWQTSVWRCAVSWGVELSGVLMLHDKLGPGAGRGGPSSPAFHGARVCWPSESCTCRCIASSWTAATLGHPCCLPTCLARPPAPPQAHI